MSGETDLRALLKNMAPELSAEEYAFAAIRAEPREIARLEPWAIIREDEGTTIILETAKAKANNVPFESSYKRITLRVHSSLDAVGLTAAVTTSLKDIGVSANVVAGFYHDHVFVKSEDGERAIAALKELARR